MKSLQQRLGCLRVKTAADPEKLDTRFLDFVILYGQGKYLGVVVAQITKVWCRRHFFDNKTLPVEDLTQIDEYLRLQYDEPHNLSKPTSRIGGATL